MHAVPLLLLLLLLLPASYLLCVVAIFAVHYLCTAFHTQPSPLLTVRPAAPLCTPAPPQAAAARRMCSAARDSRWRRRPRHCCKTPPRKNNNLALFHRQLTRSRRFHFTMALHRRHLRMADEETARGDAATDRPAAMVPCDTAPAAEGDRRRHHLDALNFPFQKLPKISKPRLQNSCSLIEAATEDALPRSQPPASACGDVRGGLAV